MRVVECGRRHRTGGLRGCRCGCSVFGSGVYWRLARECFLHAIKECSKTAALESTM